MPILGLILLLSSCSRADPFRVCHVLQIERERIKMAKGIHLPCDQLHASRAMRLLVPLLRDLLRLEF